MSTAAATYALTVRYPTGAATGLIYGGDSLTVGGRDLVSLDATIGINGAGALAVALPYRADLWRVLQPDLRLEVERTAGAVSRLLGDTAWFVNGWVDDPIGGTITLAAETAAARILNDRDIEADAGSAAADKTAAADDLIKAYVREALTTATDTARNLPATFFTVQADLGAGVSTPWSATYQRLLKTCQAISAQSQQTATPVYFDVVLVGAGGALEFRTYAGQRGMDRRAIGPRLSVERGNVTGITVRRDYSAERTAAIALGRDLGAARDRSAWQLSAEATRSPIGRRELSVAAQQAAKGATTTLDAIAAGAVWGARARVEIAGSIVQTATCRYGVDWDLGDLVAVDVRDQTEDARIDVVKIQVRGGQESIQAPLRGL